MFFPKASPMLGFSFSLPRGDKQGGRVDIVDEKETVGNSFGSVDGEETGGKSFGKRIPWEIA